MPPPSSVDCWVSGWVGGWVGPVCLLVLLLPPTCLCIHPPTYLPTYLPTLGMGDMRGFMEEITSTVDVKKQEAMAARMVKG